MSPEFDLRSTIHPYLSDDAQQIVIAYSGGVDSHVLLHAFAACRPFYPQHHVVALHVNHGLSPNADQWQSHCQHQCQALGVSFKALPVTVDQASKKGLEAAARDARYAAIYAECEDNALVLLGQHADDQLETVLLQLKRGSGPTGLAGMAMATRKDKNLVLLRPFLFETRRDIEAYAVQHQLQWIEDESNQSVAFDRNFLRHEVIPHLVERWPNIAHTVSRSARLCGQQQRLLDEVSHEKLVALMDDKLRLDTQGLLEMSTLWRYQVVRQWLSKRNATMPNERVLQQIDNVLHAKEDAQPLLQWDEWQIRRFGPHLYLTQILAQPLPQFETHVWGFDVCAQRVQLHWQSAEQQNASKYVLATCKGSLRFLPKGERHSKPLKQWCQRWQIPPWQRQNIVAVMLDQNIEALVVNGRFVISQSATTDVNTALRIYFPNDPSVSGPI